MRQEGNLSLDSKPVSDVETLDDKWSTEYIETENVKPVESAIGEHANAVDDANVLSAIDEQSAVAGSWVNEFTKDNPAGQGTSNDISFHFTNYIKYRI